MSARAWLRGLVGSALAEPAVAHLAGRLPHRLVLVADEAGVPVVEGTEDGSTVSAHAPLAVWREMLVALPPPGRQSMGAALRAECGFELRGEPLAIAQSVPLLELLVEAMRGAASAAGATAEPIPAAASHAGPAAGSGAAPTAVGDGPLAAPLALERL